MNLLLQLTPLSDAPADVAWLGGAERERLAEIRDASRAAQYLAGHCLARQLAADLSGGSAGQWQLVVGDDGRRRLEHAHRATLFASISHGRTRLAVAVGAVPLGVDLEATGQPRDWLALARTMFSPAEVQALESAPGAELECRFLATWTLKEAWAKRSGRGLRRQSARRCTAQGCDPTGAEAWTWLLPDGGSLALAASTGASTFARGVVGEPTCWRYLESAGA